jgi:DeoR/GlpR family transcriptional regulator of sugar metabolism
MIESAQRTIVVTDSSKFGRNAFAHIARLDAVECLITDAAPQPALAQAIADSGVELVIATAAEPATGPR